MLTLKDIQPVYDLLPKERFVVKSFELEHMLVTGNDMASLYYELKNIFVDKIYAFNSESRAPYIIDGGAHIGIATLFFKKMYPNAEILLFEPDKTALFYLNKNIEENGIRGVNIIEKGLYGSDEGTKFRADNSDGGKIDESSGEQFIETVRLSEYMGRQIDFLKLNIEGAELKVFREIYSKLPCVKELVFEYHAFPEFGQSLHEILKMLNDAGFRYVIHNFDRPQNSPAFPPFSLEKETKYFQLVYAKKCLG
jgi:FkbM family methyltransferase